MNLPGLTEVCEEKIKTSGIEIKNNKRTFSPKMNIPVIARINT
jgi:hypothetical protein